MTRSLKGPVRRPPVTPAPTADDGGAGPFARLLALQRTAGNRAVARVVQRCGKANPDCDCSPEERAAAEVQRLTAAERTEGLTAPGFAGDSRLEAAFDNSPPMRIGERGDPVGRVQDVLVADGFGMPRSTRPDGTMDGVFGGETRDVVHRFQEKHELPAPDGVVGRKTLGRLDALAAKGGGKGKGGGGKGSAPVPCPPGGTVDLGTDPPPGIGAPSVNLMSPTAIAAAVGKPGSPPLAAHRVNGGKDLAFPPVKVTAVETGGPCKKCVADWAPPVPPVELFIGTGSFADGKRFFVGRPGDAGGCDTGPLPDLLDVRKVIDPGLTGRLIAGEMEHWSDFLRAWQLVVGRLLGNVRRLTPARSHLGGADLADCRGKVGDFLLTANGFPAGAAPGATVVDGFAGFVPE
ncbi:MAG TPA: peptidoglycan-binding domain-containing protein, partial [Phytomonospora sp.]